jgi:mono/diheme cytochrome c family protein
MKMDLFIIIPVVYLSLAGPLIHGITDKLPDGTAFTSAGFQAENSDGNQLYIKHCLQCHQNDGKGVRGMFPPLAGNDKIKGPATDIIKIVLFGLEGPITVNERDYNQPMPPQAYLTDKQIADILSYIRNSWGNQAPDVIPADVGKVRKLGKTKN